jgi:aminomethyltransferase
MGKELQHTALHARHREAGARLVPFAGWEMPVQYAGIREEHQAVRTGVGVFDVSHMGEVESSGPQAFEFLQTVFSNDVAKIAVGGAQYSLLCREDGGVLDDLFTYRLGESRYLTVTNCANHERDLEWMRRRSEGFQVDVVDRHADFAMLALQGPRARDVAATLATEELPVRMSCVQARFAGVEALVCGTGYTGEDGLELLVAPPDAEAVWDALIAAGVTPAGLGARDTLRLEVCFHLYGNELREDLDPISAGLGWCCKEETGFIGSDAVAGIRGRGPREKLVAFKVLGEGIARGGNQVLGGGFVTSGTMSPSLGIGVGMAYVPVERSEPGTRIEIDVRGRVRAAEVVPKPLYGSKER